MVDVVLDTCVWLDLAKSRKGESVLLMLNQFIEQKKISILVPSTVVEEFKRNKDRIVEKASQSLRSEFYKVKDVFEKHGNPENKSQIVKELVDLSHKIPTLGEGALKSLQTIEEMFSKAKIIEVSDDVLLRAAQRGIDKKAPFHLSKNSMADAVIIESYNEYKIKQNGKAELIFVTHNKSDFSTKIGDERQHHEDLNDVFDSPKSLYFISLPQALHEVDPNLVYDTKMVYEWYDEPRGLTEMLKAEFELTDKVWYNRHKNREYQIEHGEISIITKEEFDAKTVNNTIVDEIWEGAKKSAKKMEDKYGEENLIWDDFEWGMLNGKLSALRWVMGEEWDSLYT